MHSLRFGAQTTHRILLSRPPHDSHITVITISKNRKSSTSSYSSESLEHWFTFTDVEYKNLEIINAPFCSHFSVVLGRLRHYCTPSCSYTFHSPPPPPSADDQSLVQSQMRQAVKITRSVQEAKQRDGTTKNYTKNHNCLIEAVFMNCHQSEEMSFALHITIDTRPSRI